LTPEELFDFEYERLSEWIHDKAKQLDLLQLSKLSTDYIVSSSMADDGLKEELEIQLVLMLIQQITPNLCFGPSG
jgi:hypothetical protein